MLGLNLFLSFFGCETSKANDVSDSEYISADVSRIFTQKESSKGFWDWCESNFSNTYYFEFEEGHQLIKKHWQIKKLTSYVKNSDESEDGRISAIRCMKQLRTMSPINIFKITPEYTSMTDALMDVAQSSDESREVRKEAIKGLNTLLIDSHEGSGSNNSTGRCEKVESMAKDLEIGLYRLCNGINHFPKKGLEPSVSEEKKEPQRLVEKESEQKKEIDFDALASHESDSEF